MHAPSWYLETGGNPDMWGIATTLYSLITGNAPDKLGRAAFLWPPQGEQSVDREAWNRFHRAILRATHEQATERFLSFKALASALESTRETGAPTLPADIGPSQPVQKRFGPFAKTFALILLVIVIFLSMPAFIRWYEWRRIQPDIDRIKAQAHESTRRWADEMKKSIEENRRK